MSATDDYVNTGLCQACGAFGAHVCSKQPVSIEQDLLEACRAQHQAIDWLLGELSARVPGFFPSCSPAWTAVARGYAAIKKAEERGVADITEELGTRELLDALEKSVSLQSHYGKLLNMHDGGDRMFFRNAAEWMRRLRELKEQQASRKVQL